MIESATTTTAHHVDDGQLVGPEHVVEDPVGQRLDARAGREGRDDDLVERQGEGEGRAAEKPARDVRLCGRSDRRPTVRGDGTSPSEVRRSRAVPDPAPYEER